MTKHTCFALPLKYKLPLPYANNIQNRQVNNQSPYTFQNLHLYKSQHCKTSFQNFTSLEFSVATVRKPYIPEQNQNNVYTLVCLNLGNLNFHKIEKSSFSQQMQHVAK